MVSFFLSLSGSKGAELLAAMSSESRGSGGSSDDEATALDRLRLSSPPPPPPPPPPLCALRAHGGDVQAAVLSPCGSLLYSGDSEGDLRIWDVEDRRTIFTLRLHPAEGGVLGLFLPSRSSFSSSSSSSSSARRRELLSQGREGTLKLWRLSESGREVVDADAAAPASPPRPLTIVATGCRGFCVLSAVESAGGGTLLAAVASEDSASVRVFDARRAELLCELSEAAAAAAASSGAEGGAGGAGREQQQQQQPRPPPSRGMAMAVSLFFAGGSDALHALVGYEDGSVVLWRCLGGAKGEGKRDGGDRDDDGARATTTTTTGTTAAVAAAHPPPRALSSLRIHFDAVTAVVGTVTQDSAAGKRSLRFFSGGADSVLASYLVEISTSSSSFSSSVSLRPGPAAKLPSRGVGALAVLQKSEDEGTLVVAGGWDGTIRLLALREAEESEEEENKGGNGKTLPPPSPSPSPLFLEPLGELEHHVAPIAALTLDASGELLASGGRDGSVALWGLGTPV